MPRSRHACLPAVSRSFLADGAPVGPASPTYRPYAAPSGASLCLPWGADQSDPSDRLSPPPPPALAGEAFLEIVGTQSPGSAPASLTVSKSYFVNNLVGEGGALIRVDGQLEELVVALVNNLLADPKQLPFLAPTEFHVLDADGFGPDPRPHFVSARNVYLGQPTAQLAGPWSTVEVTLDR